MHPHRAQAIAEQDLTSDEFTQLKEERKEADRVWLARRSKEPATRAPQHIIDQHTRNGWDIH
jgi:hypothetical protein